MNEIIPTPKPKNIIIEMDDGSVFVIDSPIDLIYEVEDDYVQTSTFGIPIGPPRVSNSTHTITVRCHEFKYMDGKKRDEIKKHPKQPKVMKRPRLVKERT